MQQTRAILGFGLKEDGKVAFPAHFHYSVVESVPASPAAGL